MSRVSMSTERRPAVGPIWSPPPAVQPTQLDEFALGVLGRPACDDAGYRELWKWSVDNLGEFWRNVARFYGWDGIRDDMTVLADASMPGADWFPGLESNYAKLALGDRDRDGVAVVAVAEDGQVQQLTWPQLRSQVGSLAHWMRGAGVGRGDRVAGYLPNGRHAIVAFLACAAVGAVWASCGQEYPADGAAARFGQLDPVLLVAADGYHWAGRRTDMRGEVRRLIRRLPSLRGTLLVPQLGTWDDDHAPPEPVSWADATAVAAEPTFEAVSFSDPLWVLFSSGSTGVPKGLVHGHGGVALEHQKLLGLHLDLRRGERFCWYSSTSWVMWNILVSGLLVGATVVLYEGSPTYPRKDRLLRLAAEYGISVLGASPGYFAAVAAEPDWSPDRLDFSHLRTIACTGSPLAADTHRWATTQIKPALQVISISGGTEMATAVAGAAPVTEVWAGEMAGPMLGVALDSWDQDARPVTGRPGELVITKPMPSMPMFLWGDADDERYQETYFSTFAGVWRHGDWITVTDRGSVIVSGRSDATLNRNGVRLGTADIYGAVETVPGVTEALVVGVELPDGEYWMPLFVALDDGMALDGQLRELIVGSVRAKASARHVPDVILAVPRIPHTKTGKKLEVPVKRLIQGWALDAVAQSAAVDDMTALEYFTRFAVTDRGPNY